MYTVLIQENDVRRQSGWGLLALAGVMVGALGASAWWTADALLVKRAVNEGRVVADMAETVGRWASQYGGIHAYTQGTNASPPGSFLTRSMYAGTTDDAGVLQGSRTEHRLEERQAMQRVETYYWKNPALVQREVADVLLASNGRAQYRMTARTVLNRNNTPNGFELEALDALQKAFAQAGTETLPREPASREGKVTRWSGGAEYWKVEGSQLLYARAVIAQKSCLKCHDKPETAPEFLRVNQQFNGGGGFGYKVGQPIGVISVKLPVPNGFSLERDGLPMAAWAGLGVGGVALLGMVALVLRGRRAEVTVDEV